MKLTIGDVLRILFAPGEPEPKPSTYDEVQAANERADMLAEICEERDEDRRLEGVEWAEAVGLEPGTEPCASAGAVRTAFDVLGRKPGEAIYDAARRVVRERDEATIAATSMRDMAIRTYRRVGEEAGVQGLSGASDAIDAVTALRARTEKVERALSELVNGGTSCLVKRAVALGKNVSLSPHGHGAGWWIMVGTKFRKDLPEADVPEALDGLLRGAS